MLAKNTISATLNGKYYTSANGCPGRKGPFVQPLDVGSLYLPAGADCHKKCLEHFECTSYEKSTSGCVLYSQICSDGNDIDANTKYYLAASHDKPSEVENTCTHKKEFNADVTKVNECKSKTVEDGCWSLNHCEWINPPKKFRDKVECGDKGQQINHEIKIAEKADLTLKECNKLCFRSLSHIPCT